MGREEYEEFHFPEMTEEDTLTDGERQAGKQRRKLTKDSLSPGERFHFILGAVAAGLVIAGVYIVVYFLFLLFAVKIGLG